MTLRRAPRSSLRLLVSLSLVGACGCGVARRVAEGPPACQRCHGAPPASGAHLLHATPPRPEDVAYGATTVLEDVAPGGAPGYFFGCGQCHPVDATHHMNGAVEVDLSPAGAPAASIKARNASGATYDSATKSCSGVYCHSSGQNPAAMTALSYRTTPAWDSPSSSLGCDGCHGNPPRYPSGGPGTPTANGHLDLDDFGWETGHFAGMAGPSHGSKHGGGNPDYADDPQQAAAPITCQACHFETVAAAPGRFFFFDPTGSYSFTAEERPSVDPTRTSSGSWAMGQCGTCHAGAAREGSVLPLRHVNGKRDVAFDRRPALSDDFVTGLPSLASAGAIRPYYVSNFLPQAESGGEIRFRFLADSVLVPVADTTSTSNVFTTTLESATYDPSTKTCGSIGCHVGRQSLVDAGYVGPLLWGQPFQLFSDCTGCHNEYGPALPP